MPASADTVLRLIKATPLPDQPVPRVVGVDDWPKRKGSSYGTIIVDLERHRVVDLLPDRTAATLTDWLQQRPGIEVVARDRSSEYASGITVGAPAAVQVADRWHLLASMRQAVERWFSGAHARLRRLSGVPSTHGVLPTCSGLQSSAAWPDFIGRFWTTFGETIASRKPELRETKPGLYATDLQSSGSDQIM